MIKYFLAYLLLFVSFAVSAQNDQATAGYDRNTQYVIDHAKLAVEEMLIYKIPASITLSQGILETGGGQSRLADKANNHFGIKCKREWKGEKIYHDDDALGECFRKYPSVRDSYRDHSKFLAERPYYKALFKLNLTDYKGWARGLKKAGYATNPRYAPLLINYIEKLKLNKFDELSSAEEVPALLEDLYDYKINPPVEKIEKPVEVAPEETPKKEPKQVKTAEERRKEIEEKVNNSINDESKKRLHPLQRVKIHPQSMRYIEVYKDEDLQTISKLYEISVEKLIKCNDIESGQELVEGQYIFFDKKKNKARAKTHSVKEGETLYLISQQYGVKLDRILKYNKLNRNQLLKEGQIIKLRR